MFIIETKRTAAELRTQNEIDGILRSLPKDDYAPIFRSGAAAILKAVGVTTSPYSSTCAEIATNMFATEPSRFNVTRSQELIGEMYFRVGNIIALQPVGSWLYAWEAREHAVSSHLSDFCSRVTESAKRSIDGRRLRGMSFDWQESTPPNLRRGMPASRARLVRPMSDLTTKPADLSDLSTDDSELLVSRERRDFLVRLAQLGKARSVDAQAGVQTTHIAPLLERGLVRKEFLVLCRQDSRTLCTIETREELEGESGQKFHCSVCGRSFSKELIQEIYAPTARAKEMLNGSHWMTVWVTSILSRSGIPLSEMSWGATAGEDEIDIVAKVQDQTIFFELKDRVFGLGDAYPFTARVQRYGANAGVIITMEEIAEEAQKFLREQARSLERKIYTISGEDEVRKNVPSILGELARTAVIDSFRRGFVRSALDPTPILKAWSTKSHRVVGS